MYGVIDLGGTITKIATVANLNQPEAKALSRFPTGDSYDACIDRIVATIEQAAAPFYSLGLAIGVQLTRDGLVVDKTYTLPDFSGKPIVRDLGHAAGLPVRAANDNVCAVIAESRWGALQPFDRAAYMTVSTGTGAGVLLNEGATSLAWLAQIGHHIVNRDGRPCICGQAGCVQAITGGQEFLNQYGKPASEIDNDAIWADVAETLAVAVVNLARITRVDAVCVGGGIGYNNAYIRQHLPRIVRATSPGVDVRTLFASLGENAPIIGASQLLRNDLTLDILH